MSPKKRTAYIVSHTHWDREWYLPYHRFRVSLVRVVDQVLDALENDESFEHFLLDGQCVALEDYLEARPEEAGRIEALVRSGALSIGPWYVLPDEFLVSGEATVRNLLVGHAVAGAIGPVQKVGYMPDSFGHIAQMPQLLRRSGIDSFIYTRGNGDELEELGLEYTWRAPDGSEVLAVNQWGGYCNASALGFEEMWHALTRRDINTQRAVEQVGDLLERMGKRTNCDALLLNNGCDHHPPQKGFGTILKSLREAFPNVEFVHGTVSDYVAAVRESGAAKGTYEGEMLGGRYHHILSGVWSARMRLKQQNDAAQTLLAGYVEPVAAYSHFLLDRPYPHGLIDYSWKLLMKNHPHDSICGCSTDEVHREMEPRFAGVRDTGEQLLSAELEYLAPAFARKAADDAETVICVVNPLPFKRTELIERLVVFQPPGIDSHRLHLYDEEGLSVPFTIVSKRYVERFWAIDYRSELFSSRQGDIFRMYLDHFGDRIVRTEAERDESDCFLTVQFVARDLPALGHANYYFRQETGGDGDESSHRPPSVWAVRVVGNSLENDLVRVTLHHNGTFDIEDKKTGRVYPGLNLYEDTEDIGDEYDYAPAGHSLTLTSADTYGDTRVIEDTGLSARLEVRYDLHLPSALEKNRDHRRPDTVACRTTTRVRLRTGSPVVEVDVDFENRARDHRLRALFPTPVVTDTVLSDGHFLVSERPIDKPDGAEWVQPPPTTYPQQEFSLVSDDRGGVAVLNRGLPEIEATRDGTGEATLALTLLRCVGWLSRDDFAVTRRGNAGPTIHTPEAQCLGAQRFGYAVVPFAGDHIAAGIKNLSLAYRTQVLTKQGVRDQCVPGGTGLLSKTSDAVCVSAVKKHETRDTLVVRLYNLTGSAVREALTLGADVSGAWRTTLLEERLSSLSVDDGRDLCVELGPHEIATLEIEFSGSETT
ncbi:MAG: glycoside hydrolase family 38 C-terminal domain-containing protein [Candidatus Eisenbacteria bacterium]